MLGNRVRFSRVLGFFLILNLLSENFGYFRRGLDVFVGALLVLIIAGCYLGEYRTGKQAREVKYLFIKCAVLLLSLVFILKAGTLRVLGLPFLIFSLWLDFEENAQAAREFSIAIVALTFYLFFYFSYQNFPHLFRAVAGFSYFLSRWLSRLARSRVELGPSVLGLPLLAAAIFYHLSLWLLAGKRRIGSFAANFPVTFINPCLALFLYLLLYVNLVEPIAMKKIQLPAPVDFSLVLSYLYPHSVHFLLLIILLPGMYLHYRLVRGNIGGLKIRAASLRYQLLGAGAVFILIFSLMFRLPCRPQGRNVHIFDRDYLGWTVPNFEVLGGQRGSGFFGRLPGFLEARGFSVTTGEISGEVLDNTDVLVVINLPWKFSAGEKQLIWDFINEEGSLLVLGDHTGMQGIREPFNDLLEPVNIEFNFDSAKPFVEGWQEALHLFPHPITRGLNTGFTEAQIWIGASLKSSPPGRPVIVGTYGFSDQGDPFNEDGFLGDLLYSPGERLGDVVLVAEARSGKGKILVFGDTSSFQNLALVSSHRFVENVFRWLTASGGRSFKYLFIIGAAVLTILLWARRVRIDVLFLLLCSGALILSDALATHHRFPPASAGPNKEKIACIDTSHCEQFNFRVWDPGAAGGLYLNLIRNGYSPLLLRKFDKQEISAADVLVLISPLRKFSRKEIDFLETFVESGGHLIVSVGWEESAPTAFLLRRFGFRIGSIPLGKVPPEKTSAGIYFASAWNVECLEEDAEVLCAAWDYPMIVTRRCGKGKIIVIGDSQFLLDKNLEDRTDYKKENIEFLRNIFIFGENK